MDLTPGKEGGTWIGASRFGKVSALLNLNSHDYSTDNPNKEGRGQGLIGLNLYEHIIAYNNSKFIIQGFMVPDFLNSKENSTKYVEKLIEKANSYNPFNLVFYERNK